MPARSAVRAQQAIREALATVADSLGGAARDTVIRDNAGKHAFEIAMMLRDAPDGARVLDVGGGIGVNLLCFRLLRPDAELHLVDRFAEYTPDNKMGDAAVGLDRLERAGVRVLNQDFWQDRRLPLDAGSFDLITILDVVEHLPGNPLPLLRELHRLLKPGGRIHLSGPNSHSAVSYAKMLTGRHPHIPFDAWTGDAYYSHYREYRPAEYAALLERSGFDRVSVQVNPEPWRTRLQQRFHKRPLGRFSPRLAAVAAVYAAERLIPGLRDNVHCRAVKPGASA